LHIPFASTVKASTASKFLLGMIEARKTFDAFDVPLATAAVDD
jgi:hypothetical protein